MSEVLVAISQQHFCEEMCRALGLEPGNIMRIVIDADASKAEPLRVYFEMVGTEKALALFLGLNWEAVQSMNVGVRRVPPDPDESPHRAQVDVTGFGGGKDYDGEGTA